MVEQSDSSSRRAFLAAGTLGAAALALGFPTPARAEEASEMEKSNLKVVNDFCEAWATMDADKVGSYLDEKVIYRISEKVPATNGRTAVVDKVKGFLKMAKSARFEVLRSAAMGSVVLDERIDHFQISPQKETAFHVIGVFFLVDGKIVEWTDYSLPKPAKK